MRQNIGMTFTSRTTNFNNQRDFINDGKSLRVKRFRHSSKDSQRLASFGHVRNWREENRGRIVDKSSNSIKFKNYLQHKDEDMGGYISPLAPSKHYGNKKRNSDIAVVSMGKFSQDNNR